MDRHISKKEFNFLSISVMVLEVAAFFVFVLGATAAVYLMFAGTYTGLSTTSFILVGFGSIVAAFLLLASAELIQLLMKIEYNTRKADMLLAKEVKSMYAMPKKMAKKSAAAIKASVKKITRKVAKKKARK